MRWTTRALDVEDVTALPGLGRISGLLRSVRSPDFAGVTFHEVLARSALNRVPGTSPMPFRWTVNPYRGCSHACVYCFARGTHTYLDLDSGQDFDSQIVVKTNVGELLGRELAAPRWRGEPVAMGTNTDPYQRAEGRYRLMPAVIRSLTDHDTPFSILTKGTVLSRDLGLLASAAQRVPVGLGVSLALLDRTLQASLEPGTPTPEARLTLVRRIVDAGLPCGVLIAPLLPHLTDSREQIADLVGRLRDAGVSGVSGIVLHLRPGAREWFLRWLGVHHPELVGRYERLYQRGSNAPQDYRRMVADRVASVRVELGLPAHPAPFRPTGVPGYRDAGFPPGSMPEPRRAPRTGVADRSAHAGDGLAGAVVDQAAEQTLF
ncbi:Rv2578c family radical SAM protein [Nakamurella endophytica]|uniref:Radical SAM protein n=1 Tax=Nakamurella endophytica TaxID=1748367 RepID=A0A917T992_9ACTN|nr:Rv2578c family radical SAM protein [Nakamurella endophytica]GGM14160.1 radical SAM protein [Nakamurella endophytica]